MTNFENASLETLIAPEGHDCACGKHHATGLRFLRIGSGAISAVPEALIAEGVKRPFVVCDDNTYKAAGKRVMEMIRAAGMEAVLFRFAKADEKMEPDEMAVGALCMAFDPQCDCIVAVGSGVINDCCKVLAHAVRLPQMVVGTAPSMDGYASNSSSMIQSRIKVTLYNACPFAIICDTDILKAAPMHMLLAGLGDMLAKYVSVCEWRISNQITGEYYCENTAKLVRKSVKRCVDAASGLVTRDPQAVEAVTEGLILSGIAMSYAQISRPASGLEHYFSHLWEMFALVRGEASDLHGTQVGVGVLLTLDILDKLRTITPDRRTAEQAMQAFDDKAWEAEMRDIFGPIAQTVIDAEHTLYHKNDAAAHAVRLEKTLDSWQFIQSVMEEELPSTQDLRALMESLGMACTPKALGISLEDTKKALVGSREIRDKYLTSSMLWDLGLLHAFADALTEA